MTQLVPSSGRRGPVGRMTAVMRAVRAENAEIILRVAIVERGRVVDERLVEPGVEVRLGAQGGLAPLPNEPTVTVFAVEGGGWRLCCDPVTEGRVARLEALPTSGDVLLTDDDRGRVRIGPHTLLFQLTEAAPRPSVRSLPPAMMDGLAIDWTTTIVAAFSFLLHFFAVALVYSDWLDPKVDEDDVVASLVETTRALPAPPLLERPRAPHPSAMPQTTQTAASNASRGSAEIPRGAPTKRGSPPPATATGGDARAAEIATELAALDVDMVTALADGGPATTDVLDGGDVPSLLLDDAAASERAARQSGGDGLALRGDGSDQVQPGAHDRRLSDLDEGTARRDDAVTAGDTEQVDGPTGTAVLGGTGQSGGNIANAGAVVARMRGRFRACYQAGLDGDPTLEGSVSLLAKVGQSGEVVSVSGGGGGLGAIVPCLKAVVQSGGFSPPEGGMGLVSISIMFRHQ